MKFFQKGVTLIELLIALVLGLTLSAGALMLFVGNKETSTLQTEFSRLQESGRFATDIIARALRNTSFYGCATRTTGQLNGNRFYNALSVDTGLADTDFQLGIYGYQSNSAGNAWETNLDGPALDATITAEATAGTDILVIRSVEGSGCRVMGNTAGVAACTTANCQADMKCNGDPIASLDVSDQCNFDDNDVVMVSDCVGSTVFQIGAVGLPAGNLITLPVPTGADSNCTNQLGVVDIGDATLNRLNTFVFLVKNNALYRYTNGVEEELIQGVEDIQFTYGEDTSNNGAINEYITANNVDNWDAVAAVRVDILVRSTEAILDTAQVIGLDKNGDGDTADANYTETVDTSDLRFRQVFSNTVVLRNRTT